MFNVVVVGADGSETARRAVEAAAELAAMSQGSLHIVTAFEPKSYVGTRPSEFQNLNLETDAEALLQSLSFIGKSRGLETAVHSSTGDPADAIVKCAEEVGADLVVVGNRGMRGVRRVLGSVPNTVAHAAPCSVLVVDTAE
ncbi:MAG: universal stress protein [Acidimicrobiales bacterium]